MLSSSRERLEFAIPVVLVGLKVRGWTDCLLLSRSEGLKLSSSPQNFSTIRYKAPRSSGIQASEFEVVTCLGLLRQDCSRARAKAEL